MDRQQLLRALRDAIATMLAALATMACALAIDPEPGSAILGIVLCMSLSRSQLDRDLRGRIEAAIALPVVSLAALGVGWLLEHRPWTGAAAFVAAITASIVMRRFGPRSRQAGSLVALPLVVLLVVPRLHATRVGPAMALALPVIVAWLAMAWVGVFHAVARRFGPLPRPARAEPAAPAATRAGGLRPSANSRMALQMAAALAVAFIAGHLLFPVHWAWLVLTAFIVGSGNQGRLDVVHKSFLRVFGAAAGTAIALAFAQGIGLSGAHAVALALAALFLGLWLRPIGYAWWALFVTLALAVLQGFEGVSLAGTLMPRLAAIVIGAGIAVAAAWFILPVRSTDVLRRRIADALAALSEAAAPEAPARTAGPFLEQLARVDGIAPAFRAARRLTRPWRALQPADWIDELTACRTPALAMIEKGAAPGRVRLAIGTARKAMREPDALRPALAALRASMEEAVAK